MSKAILAALSIILLSGVAWAYGYHELGAYCAGVSSGVSLFGIWIAWTSRPSELQSTRDWFRSLRSPSGFPCCDYADGNRVEDPDWRQNEDGSYSVVWEGEWRQVPPERVLTGTNRVGYAILWWHKGVDNPYCFLPGARG